MGEELFIFNPNQLPNQRQMIYQLCDIHDQEGQDFIHSNDGKETKFTVSKMSNEMLQLSYQEK